MERKLDPAPKWPQTLPSHYGRSSRSASTKARSRRRCRSRTCSRLRLHALVPLYIQGPVSLIEGDPGVGKSWFTLAIAAAFSTVYAPGMERPMPRATCCCSLARWPKRHRGSPANELPCGRTSYRSFGRAHDLGPEWDRGLETTIEDHSITL